ncbi:hypothetical protein D3C80_1883560 [compost metagenome]
MGARQQLWERFLVEQIPLAESREALIESASKRSDGLSGREIRTCMRLALPKSFLAAEKHGFIPRLHAEHVHAAIDEVLASHLQVSTPPSNRTHSEQDVARAKSLLGLQ